MRVWACGEAHRKLRSKLKIKQCSVARDALPAAGARNVRLFQNERAA